MRLSLLDNRRNFLLLLDEDKVIPKYTVTWKNWDGTVLETDLNVLEGGMPDYGGTTPTKASTSTHYYTFAGWSPTPSALAADTIYTATFEEHLITYTIAWVNYDGTVLDADELAVGVTPSYTGATPTKASTAAYRYEFSGWSPSITAVSGNATYTAAFTELPNTVTATFVKDSSDGGGTIKTVTVNYGETPVFGAADPASTKGVPPEITFEGWDPPLGPITQNTTYTAVFKDNRPYTVQFLARTIEEYTDIHEALSEANVTWLNWDGSLLELDKDVPIGTTPTYNGATPTRPAVSGYIYTFAGWDKQIVPLTGYTTYTATYTEVQAKPIDVDSWSTILSNPSYATNYSIKDSKTMVLTDGTEIEMDLAAIDTDVKSDNTGTAKMTWICHGIPYTHRMNAANTTSGGWADSEMRSWLISDILSKIPTEIKSHIVSVKKSYLSKSPNVETLWSDDEIWIPSYKEVGITDASYVESDGVVYSSLFPSKESLVKHNASGSAYTWWLRSASNSTKFSWVYNSGYTGSNGAATNVGVVFGFCTD